MENQIEQYQKEASDLQTRMIQAPVVNDEQAVSASTNIVKLKNMLNTREAFFKPIVESAHKAHKTATAGRNLVCDPLKAAIRTLSDKVASYQWKQQQNREAQEQKARDEATAKEKIKQDKLLEKAAQAEEAGNTDKAEELIEKAEEVYVAPKPVAAPVKTNTSVRLTYDVEILDIKKIPLNYMIVDESKLIRCKKADKELLVPGIKFRPRAIGSTRSK